MDFVPLFAADDPALDYAVTHVFFPVNIPDESDYTAQNDLSLLRAVRAAARAYTPHIDDALKPRWISIVKMLDNLQTSAQSENPQKADVMSQLGAMQSGDLLAFLVRSQHAAVIFRKQENGTLYESFEVSLNPEAVREARGSVVYSFSGLAIEIPNKVSDDIHFQEELANFLSLPSKVNSNTSHVPARRPEYITALLTGILRSVGRIVDGSRVLKHVRDEGGNRWQRSSLWLLTRVSIQTSLDRSSSGWKSSYKAFMLFFICSLAMDAHGANISGDLLFLMLAKILRRLSKLGSSTPSWLSDMALDVCRHLQDTLDVRGMELQATKYPSPHWNPSELDLIGDTRLSLPNIDEYIRSALANPGTESLGTSFRPEYCQRGTLQDFLSSTLFDEAYSKDPYAALYYVEQSVEQEIDQWINHVTNVEEACIQLGTLMNTYLWRAFKSYKDNPEYLSIMTLTWMELWVVLDTLVVAEIPMLAEYSPEITTDFLESLLLRDTMNLHRLSRVYCYLSTRHARSGEGPSVLSDDGYRLLKLSDDEGSFPARYYDSSPDLQQLWDRIEKATSWKLTLANFHRNSSSPGHENQFNRQEHTKSTMHVPPLQSKIITFELQCPAPFRIWRFVLSSAMRILDSDERELSNGVRFLSDFPELQHHIVEIPHDAYSKFQLVYVQPGGHKSRNDLALCYVSKEPGTKIRRWDMARPRDVLSDIFDNGASYTTFWRAYSMMNSNTSNDVLSNQVHCPANLSLDEFIAFGQLRTRGRSPLWINILRELRCRTLNFHSHEVYFLLAQATSEVGPLDINTGEWTLHQELQDIYFCSMLLDELERLFLHVCARSLDEVAMRTVSLLLTRVLASSPCESISDRILQLLRDMRRKTFEWVQELAYDLGQAPTDEKRSQHLHYMAATCRSTFDISTSSLHKVFHSAVDVQAFLSCSFFMQATIQVPKPKVPKPELQNQVFFGVWDVDDDENQRHTRDYFALLYQRNRRLSAALEHVLKDVILADIMDRGIDLALRDIWPGYQPGPRRWAPEEHPNSHWLASRTATLSPNGRSKLVHVNLLDGSILVDEQPLGGLPSIIRNHPLYEQLFHDKTLLCIPSNLRGMDFATLAMISGHRVHFSLRADHLVIRAQHKDAIDVFELVPQEKLQGILPRFLLTEHVYWLNLSTSIIEIRPLKEIWEGSDGNWRIRKHADGKYRIYRHHEYLMGVQSQTWTMVACLLACFDLPENLIVATSTVDSLQMSLLSVSLPHHSLSFFVNSDGDLESDDFTGMIYDMSQDIGTFFGLKKRLVLRPKLKVSEEAFSSRYVLVPLSPENGFVVREGRPPPPVTYHIYKVNSELGCLIGDLSLESKHFLAYLHAKTSIDWRPDPLTGVTGAQEAFSILLSSGYQSLAASQLTLFRRQGTQCYPAVTIAHAIAYRLGYQSTSREPDQLACKERRAAYLFSSDVTIQALSLCQASPCLLSHVSSLPDLELEDTVYDAASLVDYHWRNDHAFTINSLSLDWAEVWEGAMPHRYTCSPPSQIASALLESCTLAAQKRFQLLFQVPTLAYCSDHPQTAFLSMFLAFGKKKGNLHANYKLLDGYYPTVKQVQHLGNPPSHTSVNCYRIYMPGGGFVEIEDLLNAWPFNNGVPGFPSCSSEYPHTSHLTPALQEYFSSCYHNLRLKEDLMVTHFSRAPRLPATLPLVQYTLGQSSDVHLRISQAVRDYHPEASSSTPTLRLMSSWRVTLGWLLSTRAPPMLPHLTKFPLHHLDRNEYLYHHSPSFDRLFSSLRLNEGPCPFQEQYITNLHSSARYVREEHVMSYRTTVKGYPVEELKNHLVLSQGKFRDALYALRQSMGPEKNPLEQALARGGQWPLVTPRSLLQCLASTSSVKLSEGWKKCLVSFASLTLEYQRAQRLLRYALESLEEEFLKELESEGCDGWDAEVYPDWLLIQLQGGFLIRRVQADIAMEMISPQSGKNTVMQVNMGEGKSSVIIPIVAAFLADGHQLVRVLVPKPLMVQMLHLVADSLGGLVNRPIYHLPISRFGLLSHPIMGNGDVHHQMSQCMERCGILLAQPEHSLSLKLRSVEAQLQKAKLSTQPLSQLQKLIHKHDMAAVSLKYLKDSHISQVLQGLLRSGPTQLTTTEQFEQAIANINFERQKKESDSLLELQKWLHSYARDILDESDDILHTRHQLIYTIGHEQHVESYPDRWTVIQHVLELVRRHAHSLSQDLPNSVEYSSHQPGSFPHFRISRTSDAGRRLISLLVEDVMAGQLPTFNFRHMSQAQQNAIRTFISSRNIQFDKAKEVEDYARHSLQTNFWSGLLHLRGLFASDILLYALTERRWRVDYGLHPKPEPRERYWHRHTNLAVPYRAKDVPAPDTQFGQPDIIILFTCLSYYYTGLTEEQLKTTFRTLLNVDDPAAEYAHWVKGLDSTTPLPNSLRRIRQFNLESSEQWDSYLFPVFSCNKAAIDFYLSHIVFPREAKEYPWRLAASSWDLAEKRAHPITGFSGTNDSRCLLPMSIMQHGLDHQGGANARILSYLLQPENDSYTLIPREDDKPPITIDFLKVVIAQQPEIRVLLDVGAQILDVHNRDLAKQWLGLTSSAGAVYFDEHDNLMVLMRNGMSQPLMSSCFAQRLDRCVIYLDDAHTRGTDLKFPKGFRAAVTLGPRVTKDRLVQGCMRMRKLGRDHSVMFFAPLEVDQSIRSITCKEDRAIPINTADILKWAIHETWSDIRQWAPYWARQGMDHTTRHDAWTRFCEKEITQEQLSDAWLQPEAKSLADLYAPYHELQSNSGSTSLKLHKDIERHCEYLGVSMSSIREAQLDEQVEREVERQIEKEREVELPPEAQPAKHFLHPDVIKFVQTGVLRASDAFRPVFTNLENTSAASIRGHTWSPFILATADFCETIKQISTQGRLDQYLRPVQWVLSGKKNGNRVLVVLSPFEVDRLLPDIRISEHVHLHVYAPRTSERMKPTDDLRFYSIPPVPDDWTPPWDLIDQLNIFAGQVYLRDWDAYLRLTRFLDVREKADKTGKTPLYNLFTPESWKQLTDKRPDSLLPSVMMLLAIRRRGLSFAETHMGKILQGRLLTEKDFEGPALSNSRHEPTRCDGQMQTKIGSGRILSTSSSDMHWDGEDSAVSSSIGRGSKYRSEADGDSETSAERLQKPQSYFDFENYLCLVSGLVI